MPIRPENRALYPRDWPGISKRIREDRAKGRCECDGRCGKHNGACPRSNREQLPSGTVVVLTVMHLDHDPRNCADDNLLAACQRCHLAYDQPMHMRNSSRTRDRKSGQGRLFQAPEGR